MKMKNNLGLIKEDWEIWEIKKKILLSKDGDGYTKIRYNGSSMKVHHHYDFTQDQWDEI
jgi:hypothetical protein